MKKYYINKSLIISSTVITALCAQIKFNIGPIPYTIQNLGIVLSGLLLPPKHAAFSQILYLIMIALGLPLASGFRGGIHVLIGYTAGYLWMFPIMAFLVSCFRRFYLKKIHKNLITISKKDALVLLILTLIAALPMYTIGFIVFYIYTTYSSIGSMLSSWAQNVTKIIGLYYDIPILNVFIASILMFIPQDLFMDHLLAIIVARNTLKYLKARGVEILD